MNRLVKSIYLWDAESAETSFEKRIKQKNSIRAKQSCGQGVRATDEGVAVLFGDRILASRRTTFVQDFFPFFDIILIEKKIITL
jgi:hypothetical protein